METSLVIEKLKSLGDEAYKANVVRLGIPGENSLGVSVAQVRSLAKELKKEPVDAFALWRTGYHEARLLAVLLMDKKHVSLEQIESLMDDIVSWDLCDHLCKNLIVELPGYRTLIEKWAGHGKTYYKRAAYSLMANAVVHDKTLTPEDVRDFIVIIGKNADDSRDHVRKALSWALREAGKKDCECLDHAITLAYELKDSGDKDRAWVGRDALKELETLTKTEGRGRLISSKSKMGRGEC